MNFPVIDLHCDTVLALLGDDMNQAGSLRKNDFHIDLERASRLGGYAQCFACFTTPFMEEYHHVSPVVAFEREIATLQREMDRNNDLISIAYSPKEIEENRIFSVREPHAAARSAYSADGDFPKKGLYGGQSRCGIDQIPEKYRHDARCAADPDGFFRNAAIHFRRGNAVRRKKLYRDLSGGACVAVLHRDPAVSLDFLPISREAGCSGGRYGDDLSPPPRTFPFLQASGRHGDGKRALLPRSVAFRAGGAG